MRSEQQRKRPPAAGSQEARGVLERAIALLDAFVDGQAQWGVRELAAATGEPTSTVHRMLNALRKEGLIEFSDDKKKYEVGFELYRIAAVLGRRHRVTQVAVPMLEALAESLDETVWLSLYDRARQRMVCMADASPTHDFRPGAQVGGAQRVTADPAGWAVLAHLDDAVSSIILKGEAENAVRAGVADWAELCARVREAGYAAGPPAASADDTVMVAAPIRDAAGDPCGSLCVAIARERLGADDERRLGLALYSAAARLSYLLGATLLGGASVGSWHDAATVISSLLKRNLPGISVTPMPGGGSRNLDDLQLGRASYCLTTAASLQDAYYGLRGFSGAHDRLRAVMNLSALYLHAIVRPGIEIRSLQDLAGLRVSPGEHGFSAARLFDELLACAGSSHADMRHRGGDVLYFDYPEGQRQLCNANVDVLIWLTGLGNPFCRELAAVPGVRFAALDGQELDRVAQAVSGYRMSEIPGATYAKDQCATRTLMVPTVMVTTTKRSDTEVYELTRTVFENRHELGLASTAMVSIGGDFSEYGVTVPPHPGAERFWSERRAIEE